jgi:hypothetical protein
MSRGRGKETSHDCAVTLSAKGDALGPCASVIEGVPVHLHACSGTQLNLYMGRVHCDVVRW